MRLLTIVVHTSVASMFELAREFHAERIALLCISNMLRFALRHGVACHAQHDRIAR